MNGSVGQTVWRVVGVCNALVHALSHDEAVVTPKGLPLAVECYVKLNSFEGTEY